MMRRPPRSTPYPYPTLCRSLEIVDLTSRIKQADPGYDLAHFTTGYEYMITEMKERGVEVNAGLDHSAPTQARRSGSDYESGL